MRRQKCSQCGTILDVASLERGSKFACSSCGTILVVGEAAAVKRSLKGAGPAFKRKAKPKTEAADAPVRSRRARSAEPREPAGKSKLPLFLGLGAVVLIGVVAAVFLGGDSGGPAGGGAGGGPAAGSTAGSWWADIATKLALADADTIRGWFAEAKAKGYDQDPGFWAVKEHDLYRQLLKKDPDDPDANRYAGRKDLRSTEGFAGMWDAMNESYTALPDDVKAFVDRYAAKVDADKGIWLSDDEHVAASAVLATFRAWHKERSADPAAPRIEQATRQAKAILKGFEFVPAVGGPFILLLGYDAAAADAEQKKAELAEHAKRLVKPLAAAHAEFDRRFRQPLGLHEIERGRYFIQVGLANQTAFSKFLREGEGYDVQGDVQGFFSWRTNWAGVVTSRDAQGAPNIGPDLGHEAVHQLQYYYSKDPKKKFTPNLFSDWTGLWFSEGLAEYVGGGLKYDPASGDTEFTGFAERRVAFLQGMRDNGVPLIAVREVVQLQSLEAWQRYVHGTWLSGMTEDEDMPESAIRWLGEQPGLVPKIMYAHCWYLAYFLNEYENGKYAAKYRDLLMTALRGKQKPEAYRTNKGVLERWGSAYDAFRDIFGLEDAGAWQALNREYEKFLPKTLRKAG